MELKQGQKLGACGGFQRGKTTTVHDVVQRVPAVVVFDPKGEWHRKFGFTPATTATMLHVARKVAQAKGPRRIAVQVRKGSGLGAEFEAFCAAACKLHGWVVVLDELGMVISSASSTVLERYPSFSELWRIGHSSGITVIWCTHRWSDVPVILREVEHRLFFGAKARRDRELIQEEFGDAALAAVLKMPPFAYLYVGPDEEPCIAPPVKRRAT